MVCCAVCVSYVFVCNTSFRDRSQNETLRANIEARGAKRGGPREGRYG